MDNYKNRLQEKFEKEYFDDLYNVKEYLANQNETARNILLRLGQNIRPLPNAVVTIQNKMRGIMSFFDKLGKPFFAPNVEQPIQSEDEIDMYAVPASIMFNLTDYLVQSVDQVHEYINILRGILSKELEYGEKVDTTLKDRILAKLAHKIMLEKDDKYDFLKYPIKLNKPVNLYLDEDELYILNKLDEKYRNIDDCIWNYNIKEDLGMSIVNLIIRMDMNVDEAYKFLKTEIVPYLKEVGLTKFLPEVKDQLLKYYEQQELLKVYEEANEDDYEDKRKKNETQGDNGAR